MELCDSTNPSGKTHFDSHSKTYESELYQENFFSILDSCSSTDRAHFEHHREQHIFEMKQLDLFSHCDSGSSTDRTHVAYQNAQKPGAIHPVISSSINSALSTDKTHFETKIKILKKCEEPSEEPIENIERFNPFNERMKYKYRIYLRREKGYDDKTVISVLKQIRQYENFSDFILFTEFNDILADQFIRFLESKDLSASYLNSCVRNVRELLYWLQDQPGYKKKLSKKHISYLKLTRKQRAAAKAVNYQEAHDYGTIIDTIRKMPSENLTQRRNRAMICLQALSSLRSSELRTIKIKNLKCDQEGYFIYVSPKDMEVKFSKTRQTDLIQLEDDVLVHVIEWRDFLLSQEFPEDAPLFPSIKSNFGKVTLFNTVHLPEMIRSSSTIANIFKEAFHQAGHKYLRPHSFRHTYARAAGEKSFDVLQAASQSLGHDSIQTTIRSYGQIPVSEQRKRIANTNWG
ncbi:MAG: tyrosine-type recombinase/integrase [Alphaproteobacteria bacterium]|nr:tyrosine-type recombinase/integrase [Alphaproteobacteria bacterium]